MWRIWNRFRSCPHTERSACVLRALREVQHEDGPSVSPKRLQGFKWVTANDQDMEQLISAIHHGWPLHQKDCPVKLVPYYDSRRELVQDSGLVYHGEHLVVSHLLRTDMLNEIHRSHIGIGGSLRRAPELLYWSRINTEVKHYVSKCSVHRPAIK